MPFETESAGHVDSRSLWARALRFLLHPIVIVLVFLIGGIAIAWLWPKSVMHSGTRTTADYVGFSHQDDSWLFKARYYRLHGTCGYGTGDVEFSRIGYNPFVAHYPDGTLMARGTCRVAAYGAYDIPVPDFDDVTDAVFFKPDGTVGSEVAGGTGIETLFDPAGDKYFELHVRESKRVRLRFWYKNGQLRLEENYRDGIEDGPYMTFYENGAKAEVGTKSGGYRLGRFTHYAKDGTVDRVEVYGPQGKGLLQTERYEKGKLVHVENP